MNTFYKDWKNCLLNIVDILTTIFYKFLKELIEVRTLQNRPYFIIITGTIFAFAV